MIPKKSKWCRPLAICVYCEGKDYIDLMMQAWTDDRIYGKTRYVCVCCVDPWCESGGCKVLGFNFSLDHMIEGERK